MSSYIRSLCEALPKAELHAHLHGCARMSTIAELAPAGLDTSRLTEQAGVGADRSLDVCFEVFGAIHKTVTSLAAVRRVAREVLADFAADNVKYLELRTTPRELSDADAEGYVRAVLDVFAAYERETADAAWPLSVRLLLSVDRTGGAERAMATVRLAARLRDDASSGGAKYIVGVDFSGNPTRGKFADYVEVFEEARRCGLRIAVHVGEVDDPQDTAAVVRFRPDRLGHALLLTAEDRRMLAAAPVPIELCPTSNLKTLQLGSLCDHPTMQHWLTVGYPVSISTDDSSVFCTTASRELELAAAACDLSPERVAALAAAPLDHAFGDGRLLEELRGRFAAEASLRRAT